MSEAVWLSDPSCLQLWPPPLCLDLPTITLFWLRATWPATVRCLFATHHAWLPTQESEASVHCSRRSCDRPRQWLQQKEERVKQQTCQFSEMRRLALQQRRASRTDLIAQGRAE